MHSELAGLDPVTGTPEGSQVPSDELVDITVVKRIPQVLFLHIF